MSTKTPKKQSKAQKKAEPVDQVELPPEPPMVGFDDAVKLGRDFVAAIKFNEMELGRLADRIEPVYREETIARFAEEIDFPLDRVTRALSVFRAYKGTAIEGTSPKFSVAQALQAHPDRVNIIKANPDMTTAVARTIAQAANGKQKKKKPKSRDTAGWLRAAVKDALDAHKEYGHATAQDIDPDTLRIVFHDPEQTVATLRKGAKAYNALADIVEGARLFDDARPKAA